MLKIILYIIIVPCVAWSMDSINYSMLFKKGNVSQYRARLFYMFIVIGLSYLVVNFINDFVGVIS